MPDLRPTKTRLALLRGVADREVFFWPDGTDAPAYSSWQPAGVMAVDAKNVSARVLELMRAGWVQRSGRLRQPHGVWWGITEVGRKVLGANGG